MYAGFEFCCRLIGALAKLSVWRADGKTLLNGRASHVSAAVMTDNTRMIWSGVLTLSEERNLRLSTDIGGASSQVVPVPFDMPTIPGFAARAHESARLDGHDALDDQPPLLLLHACASASHCSPIIRRGVATKPGTRVTPQGQYSADIDTDRER